MLVIHHSTCVLTTPSLECSHVCVLISLVVWVRTVRPHHILVNLMYHSHPEALLRSCLTLPVMVEQVLIITTLSPVFGDVVIYINSFTLA